MNDKDMLNQTLPIVAVRGSVVFPHTDSLLSFGRQRSLAAVSNAFKKDKTIAIFTQKDARTKDPGFDDLYKIGTVATITQMMSAEDEIHAMVRGKYRVELKEILTKSPYLIGEVDTQEELDSSGEKTQALANKLAEQFKKSINLGKSVEITAVVRLISGKIEPVELVDSVASVLEIKAKEKQRLLEELSVYKRTKKVIELLSHEMNVLDLERAISVKTQKRFEDQMRKAMLREKKRTIEQELGEEEGFTGDEIDEYRLQIKQAKMPKKVEEKTLKELDRLARLPNHSPESGYIRNWLDVVVAMPWSVKDKSKVSIETAKKQLDKDHYGLKKVKQRILEYLAVMKLNDAQTSEKNSKKKSEERESHPTILCFIGPPGVGKTSIGKSIAKSMGREFVRVSLGGVRDEAEIRGHRRTYVGALPGRIIQGIKDAGTKNPVFMLDEIDKLGQDFRGDPSSALLEALDPEQNKEFSDHYLEVPFDLSEVFFIATGNMLDTIPAALRDRMEIIQFSGYTEEEKMHIGQTYLWPKQLRLNGLRQKDIKLSDEAAKEVISHYTREAGVRNLERSLANICRKVARIVAEDKKFPKTIEAKHVRKYLGPRQFRSLIAEQEDEIGMSTGLAVTQTGGEILFIEVAIMPGKGKLLLTGQLGEVMQESAKAAFTWAKSHWSDLGLKDGFARKIDVHIHVPEGAVPKDGPSAGIAMTTALISALTGKKVKKEVGMTGEVTLRGRVLEIGGVKQKVLAGHRAGLKTIILPKDNKKNVIEDVPKSVRKDIDIVYADNMSEVLGLALRNWKNAKTKMKKVPAREFIAASS